MEVDDPVWAQVLSPTNILQSTSTDVYSDSDDSYDILIDNLYNRNSGNATCHCIICIERSEAREDRKKKKKDKKRRKKAKKQSQKIKINSSRPAESLLAL